MRFAPGVLKPRGYKLLTLQMLCSFHVVIGIPYYIWVSFHCVGGGAGFFGHLWAISCSLKSGLGIFHLGVIGGVF